MMKISLVLLFSTFILAFSEECIICSKGEQQCGFKKCFNPSRFHCLSDVVCPRDQLLCGKSCYTEASYNCDNNVLCPKPLRACGDKCYHPDREKCINTIICPLDTDSTCNKRCFKSNSGVTCHFDELLCKNEEKVCGIAGKRECYGNDKQCLENILCKIGERLCGKCKCYNPESQECFSK